VGEVEVGDSEATVAGHQEVGWLDVAVNKSARVDVHQLQEKLRRHRRDRWRGQLSEVEESRAAGQGKGTPGETNADVSAARELHDIRVIKVGQDAGFATGI
jgi:hypothetical protein